MSQPYSDPRRASDPHVLPDVETFRVATLFCRCGVYSVSDDDRDEDGDCPQCGRSVTKTNRRWYYWFCSPGCPPDCDLIGPFASEDEALAHAFEAH